MKKLFFTLISLLLVHLAMAQCNPQFGWQASSSNNNFYHLDVTNNTVMTGLNNSAQFEYDWGDGSPHTYFNAFLTGTQSSHNYASGGSYTVTLYMSYTDTFSSTTCNNSYQQTVTVSAPSCATSISYINNGQGSFSFSASSLSSGMTYAWDFGDASTSSLMSPTHQYMNPGTYTVTLAASGGGCIYYNSVTITATAPNNCSQAVSNFTTSFSNLDGWFYASSTPMPGWTRSYSWDYGDGVTGSGLNSYHQYAANGTYTITLQTIWTDSITNTVACTQTSAAQTYTLPIISFNDINGYIFHDSTSMQPATFKVWLIQHDVSANTLTAVDSTMATGVSAIPYSFTNVTGGDYLVKAALQNGPTSGSGEVPTYYTSSLYWNQATTLSCNGVNLNGANIFIQQGMVTSGPGFIGGNISQGANKGTSTGIPDILIMLKNASGQLVKFMYTDALGDYSFNDLPLGQYVLFPEALNYLTTPMTIELTAAQTSSTGNNFGQTADELKPKATGIGHLPAAQIGSIYPNPSNGKLSIRYASSVKGSVNVSVSDLMGRKVFEKAGNANGNTTALDLTELNAGVYFIRLESADGQQVEKLIVNH